MIIVMKESIKLIKALSDETRMRIFLLLSQKELCVCELMDILKMEQSRISHALRPLKESDLVTSRREGTWILYSLNRELVENPIIYGIIKAVKPGKEDMVNLIQCKKANIKQKCKVGE